MDTPSRIALVPLRNRRGEVVANAVIDAADAGLVGQWRWCLNGDGYAWQSLSRNRIYLHRLLAGASPGDGFYVDHINRDRLDNRRANLRIVTPRESAQNKPPLTGRYRGVGWDQSRQRWMAKVQLDGRTHNLGRFRTEEEAAKAAEAFRRDRMPFSVEDVR